MPAMPGKRRIIMKYIAIGAAAIVGFLVVGVVALALIGSQMGPSFAGAVATEKELDALNDRQVIALGNCQIQKVYEDLGKEAGDKYFDKQVNELLAHPNSGTSAQVLMAQDGYWCSTSERSPFLAGLPKGSNKIEPLPTVDSEATAPRNAPDTSYTAEEDAIKGATVYYEAAAAGDWATTYSLLTYASQSNFTEDEWFTANEQLGVGAYSVLSATETSPGTFEVIVDVSGTQRATYFIEDGGVFYHDLTGEEISMFSEALGESAMSASASASASATADSSSEAGNGWSAWEDGQVEAALNNGADDMNCEDLQGPVAVNAGDEDNLDADGDGAGCD
jgi:hypothetical protein